MSGGGGTTQTVQKSEPPAYLAPYLTDIANLAQTAFYGGSPMNPAAGGAPPGAPGAPMAQQPPPMWGGGARRRPVGDGFGQIGPTAAPTSSGAPVGQVPQGFAWPEYFPDSTVVPFSPETNQALNMQSQRALSGSPLTAASQRAMQGVLSSGGWNPANEYLQGFAGNNYNPANEYLQGTARGDYLTGGQGFNAALQAATNKILPQVGSAFGGAGRLNSGLAQTATAGAIGDAFSNLYGQERSNQLAAQSQLGQNYLAGRGQQIGAAGQLGQNYLGGLGALSQAAALSPSLAQQDYSDIGQLAQVGAQRESMTQQQLQDQINRFNFQQNRPYDMLSRYAGYIGGIPAMGGTSTSTAPGASMGQNLLGGGLAGAGLGQMFGAGAGLTGTAAMGAFAPWALGGAALMGLLR